MEIALIGEYEVTLSANRLAIHHLPRGFDVAALEGESLATLRDELGAPAQKRIRRLEDGHQAIFGASGDLTIYDPAGRRACYLTADQVTRLIRLFAPPPSNERAP